MLKKTAFLKSLFLIFFLTTNISSRHRSDFGISFGVGSSCHRPWYNRQYFGFNYDPIYDGCIGGGGPMFGIGTNLVLEPRPETAEEISRRVVHREARDIEIKISRNSRKIRSLEVEINRLERQIDVKEKQAIKPRANEDLLKSEINRLKSRLEKTNGELKLIEEEKQELVTELKALSSK